MPPFMGNEAEKKALAYYIVKGLHGKDVTFPGEGKAAAVSKGKELFTTHCTMCHPESLVKEKTAAWERGRIRKSLDNLNALNPGMPDYAGTQEEKELMADYIDSLKAGAGEAHDEGREVFEKHCAMCHSLKDGANPLLPMMAGWTRERVRGSLDMLQKLKGGMPPLQASNEEKDALATYLVRSLQGGAR